MKDDSGRGSAEAATVPADDERSIESAGRSSPVLSLDHLLDLWRESSGGTSSTIVAVRIFYTRVVAVRHGAS